MCVCVKVCVCGGGMTGEEEKDCVGYYVLLLLNFRFVQVLCKHKHIAESRLICLTYGYISLKVIHENHKQGSNSKSSTIPLVSRH